jgi:hypothetical protein
MSERVSDERLRELIDHAFTHDVTMQDDLDAALRELAALREDAPKVSADDTLSNANLSKSCARLRGALRLLEDNDFLRCERENRDEHDNWCGCVPCQARAALAAQAAPSQDLRGGDP